MADLTLPVSLCPARFTLPGPGTGRPMKAVVWHHRHDVRVDTVPDPGIEEPNDVIIRVTSSGICGSDLHRYEALGRVCLEGDILGHEAMGHVEEVGPAITNLRFGDRVVIPCNIACGHCFMCTQGLPSQCETTQIREYGNWQVPGGQAEYLRVPQAQFGPIVVPDGPPDDRFVYLSDVLPTAWQAYEYAAVPPGGTLAVLGLGPVGDMTSRVAQYRGATKVIGVDLVSSRLDRARRHGVEALDLNQHDDLADTIRGLTHGRGPDSVVDAVGLQAYGSPPRLAAEIVRRGGTISIVGEYTDPLPLATLFDKQVQVRMGYANVRTWVDDIFPALLRTDDPLGVETFATHRVPLSAAPAGYENFQQKKDGTVKVLLNP